MHPIPAEETPTSSSLALRERVLVVIPCLNEEANIARVINAMLEERNKYDLLVVAADGGSSDATPDIVRRMAMLTSNIRLIDNPARRQSAGVNLAVKLFGEGRRWLIRVDAHAEYPRDFISSLIEEASRTGASSVVVAMHSEGNKWFQRAAATAQNSVLGTGGSAHRMKGAAGFVDHGHHALFDMAMFFRIKGYDESQSHNEDAELDVRLARAGGRIWLTRATSITYYPRDRATALYRQYQNYGRGRALTLLRHHVRPKARQLVPAAILPALAMALLAPWFSYAALPACLWLATCLCYGGLLGVRLRRSYAFASSLPAIIMHIAWSIGFWQGLLEAPSAGYLRGTLTTR